MHTPESDPAVRCTPQSFLKTFDHLTLRSLTPQYDAQHRDLKKLKYLGKIETDVETREVHKKSPNDIVINAGDYYYCYSQSVLIGYTE